jgi:hypothetical protein
MAWLQMRPGTIRDPTRSYAADALDTTPATSQAALCYLALGDRQSDGRET